MNYLVINESIFEWSQTLNSLLEYNYLEIAGLGMTTDIDCFYAPHIAKIVVF